MRYSLLIKTRVKYMCIVLLQEMINFQHYFPTKLVGKDIYLGPYLDQMVSNGVLTIRSGEYIPTEHGREELQKFYNRYYEYLKMFDIFCAVDLASGEFAFSRINDDSFSDDDWYSYLNDERFSDVRVAVADFKGLDPTEIVFMSFLNEGRFNINTEDGEVLDWQYNLTNEVGGIWDEIETICNTAIDVDYLREDGVLEDVIRQGSEIAIELIRESEELNSEKYEEVENNTEVIEIVEIVEMPEYGYDYWDPYYDPYYVSPIWVVPILLW